VTADGGIFAAHDAPEVASEKSIDMGVFNTLRFLLHGVLDARSVNQVNAATLRPDAETAPA
jgi:hypothetical protein